MPRSDLQEVLAVEHEGDVVAVRQEARGVRLEPAAGLPDLPAQHRRHDPCGPSSHVGCTPNPRSRIPEGNGERANAVVGRAVVVQRSLNQKNGTPPLIPIISSRQ